MSEAVQGPLFSISSVFSIQIYYIIRWFMGERLRNTIKCGFLVILNSQNHLYPRPHSASNLLAGKGLECQTQDQKFEGSILPHGLWEILATKI